MGGAAFPALEVLRLNEEEWALLRDQCMGILKNYFVDVSCPRTAPEKTSHGDVDIWVCNPKQEIKPDAIQKAISAIDRSEPGPCISYAVPFPGKEGKYAQIDVQQSKDGYLDWDLWCAAYGDLLQILGLLNRNIGLTINDKGLNVRVEELESTNRKKSMILLSKEPREVMGFLGLDVERWVQGFTTQDEIFSWCSKGRYYSRPVKKTGENAADRARFRKRPMFTRFLELWLPDHPDVWGNKERCPRKQVLEEALRHFDVTDQYEALVAELKRDQRHDKLVQTVGTSIPAGKNGLKMILRGVKRWVTWGNGQPTLDPEDHPRDRDDAPSVPDWLQYLTDDDMDQLVAWIKDNHLEIRAREERRGEQRKQQNCPAPNHELEA